jgi:RimJ/RimL family protein N-acetyltransferase
MDEPMILRGRVLEGAHVRLEPVHADHEEEIRAALDCDADNWQIQSVSGMGEHFPGYWALMTQTPGRISFAIRDLGSGRLAGTSSLFAIEPVHRTCEIGYSWLRPEFRGGAVNPEAKLLMLAEAFGAGALRVQFSVDARNERSRAAVLKLGAREEGIMRRHRITWNGHRRDTALFSIIESEWPGISAALHVRLARLATI